MCAMMEAGTREFEITLNMRVICEKNSLCEVNPPQALDPKVVSGENNSWRRKSS